MLVFLLIVSVTVGGGWGRSFLCGCGRWSCCMLCGLSPSHSPSRLFVCIAPFSVSVSSSFSALTIRPYALFPFFSSFLPPLSSFAVCFPDTIVLLLSCDMQFVNYPHHSISPPPKRLLVSLSFFSSRFSSPSTSHSFNVKSASVLWWASGLLVAVLMRCM